jgi:hypothetical protein
MKSCQECQFLNLSRAYVCLRCATLLSSSEPTPGQQLGRELEPYLYVGPIAACLLDRYFPPEQQSQLLDKILLSVEEEQDHVAQLDLNGCEKQGDNLRSAFKRMLFLIDEALAEGQDWPVEEWQTWLEECDEVEADLVCCVDAVEAAGHPAPLLVFSRPTY